MLASDDASQDRRFRFSFSVCGLFSKQCLLFTNRSTALSETLTDADFKSKHGLLQRNLPHCFQT